jgi:molybdate transport system ATP-binding protein
LISSGARVRVRLPLARFELDFVHETDARIIGIFGPSGSGKTSALEAIAGWRRVREGRVELGGRTLLDTERAIDVRIAERGIGYVPQDALLFPHWDVERNIRCGERRARRAMPSDHVDRAPTRSEFERAVSVLELGPLLRRRTTSLSGGERQRVALARALCSSPQFLLLDEPLGALDLPLRRRILPYLIRVRESFDVPMLFVSHDATEVQALCDEVVVMREGRVVASGRPSHVLSRSAHHSRGFENVLRGTVTSASGGTAKVEVAPGVEVIVPGSGLAAGDRALFSLGEDEILVSRSPVTGISARNLLPARVENVVFDGDDATLETVIGDRGSGDSASSVDSARPGDSVKPRDSVRPRDSATPCDSAAPGDSASSVDAASSGGGGDASVEARLCVRITRASAEELALAPSARIHLVFKTQSCRVLSALAPGPDESK